MISKYGNNPNFIDGIRFASKAEAKRYCELKLLERSGQIKELQLQPKFLLQDKFVDREGNKHRAVHYIADFQYKMGEYIIVEDVKSKITRKIQLYRDKVKIFIKNMPSGYVFREVIK